MSDQGEPGRPDERDGQSEEAGRVGRAGRELPRSARLATGILGPILLTVAYFTLPFDPISADHPVLAWVILVGFLTVLAVGMVLTTAHAMTDASGNPGLGFLLLSWASILAFAASYWAMATNRGQFVGLTTRLDALYFTGVTVATVGYGDIHPSGQLGRAVVLVQLLYTFVFLVGGVAAIRTRNRDRLARRVGR